MNPTPQRIAVFQALNLGDFLCITPALRALRRAFPTAGITFIGRPWAKRMIETLGTVDCFLPFPGFPGIAESPAESALPAIGNADVGARQAVPSPASADWRPAFDLAIQMHGSGEVSNGFVAALGARQSIGYGPPGDRRLTHILPWVEDEPEPLRWLRLVAAIGARPLGAALEFPITQAERAKARRLIGAPCAQPLIGLHVGSSLPNRRWPAASFARLGEALAQRFGARLVLTGSALEQPLTADVRHAMPHPVIDLAGETSLGEFAAVIAALDLLVTNDTGASHVAAAARTRSVVLYGPSRPARWAPPDQELHRRIDAAAIVPAHDGAAALQALPVQPVLEACVSMLRDAQPQSVTVTEERIAWAG